MDPNSGTLTAVIGVLGFVLKFIKNLKIRSKKLPSDYWYKSEIKNILLTDDETEPSQTHFLLKSNHWSQNICQNISVSMDIHRQEWDIMLQWENFDNCEDPSS